VAKSDDYQYRGKTLTFCSREQLIECIIEQHREIRTTRKQRDNYLDEVIALKRDLADQRRVNNELHMRLFDYDNHCAVPCPIA
jgi:hypothetical protein